MRLCASHSTARRLPRLYSQSRNSRAHKRTRRHGVDSRRRIFDGLHRPLGRFLHHGHDAIRQVEHTQPIIIAFMFLDGFWMDTNDVTNAKFEKFVEATGYKTVAEIAPTKRTISPPPRRKILSPVPRSFTPPGKPVPLDDYMQWWRYVHGANWRASQRGAGQQSLGAGKIIPWCRSPTPTTAAYAEMGGQAVAHGGR